MNQKLVGIKREVMTPKNLKGYDINKLVVK